MPLKVRRGLWLLLVAVVAYAVTWTLQDVRDPSRRETWLEVAILIPTWVGFLALVTGLVLIAVGLLRDRR